MRTALEQETTTIYLIRHSEKMRLPHDPSQNYDRIQPLTGFGEEKEKALLEVEEIRNADLAYCSAFARTIATLRYLQEADGFQMILDDRLRELDFGGKPRKEDGAMPFHPEPHNDPRIRLWEDHEFAYENGESVQQCGARMDQVIQEIIRAHGGKKILVGTHGHSICAYLSSLVSGIDLAYERKLAKPSITRIRFCGSRAIEAERLPFYGEDGISHSLKRTNQLRNA